MENSVDTKNKKSPCIPIKPMISIPILVQFFAWFLMIVALGSIFWYKTNETTNEFNALKKEVKTIKEESLIFRGAINTGIAELTVKTNMIYDIVNDLKQEVKKK
jgi:hypothetical protein